MKPTVEFYSYDNLPEQYREENKWAIRDYANFLVITWGDGEVQIETDRGEPEDRYFTRDFSWIKPALERMRDES